MSKRKSYNTPEIDAQLKLLETPGWIKRILHSWRECPKCHQWKRTVEENGDENFYRDDHQHSGWKSRCKLCSRKNTPTND